MKLTVDLLKLRHPRVGQARQTKLYLSQVAFERLRETAHVTGLDMSAIVDTLIMEVLGDGVAEAPYEAPPPPDLDAAPKMNTEQDFVLDD